LVQALGPGLLVGVIFVGSAACLPDETRWASLRPNAGVMEISLVSIARPIWSSFVRIQFAGRLTHTSFRKARPHPPIRGRRAVHSLS
jgi:hypothetical protein